MISRLSPGAILLVLLSGSAFAADKGGFGSRPVASGSFISEVRLGAQAHDPWSPEKGSVDLTGTVLFPKPFRLEGGWDILVPRPHIGGALNFSGDTSHAHVGLTWTFDITQRLFVEASFGGAIHNGETGRAVPAGKSALGCSPLFRESAGIGFRIDQNWSVIAQVEHLSNAGLCRQNRGLTNVGAQLGYRF